MGFFLPTPMLVAVVAVWRNGIFFQNRASRGGEAPAAKIPFARVCPLHGGNAPQSSGRQSTRGNAAVDNIQIFMNRTCVRKT